MDKLENSNPETLTGSESFNSDWKKKRLKLIIIIVSCVIVVTLVIVLSVVLTRPKYDPGTPETNNYGCMCDAGSSSTRVSVYSWPERKLNTIPVISEVGRESISPGMHTKSDNEIEEAMNFLIDSCRNIINNQSSNKANISEANFYLKGTAGMRSIPVEEQNKKLDIIRKTIRKSKFKFLQDDWAKVINGSEEGMFGWITGNYLNRILFENEKAGKIEKQPYGSIDLGGYSLEITFYTSGEIKEHKVDLSLSNIKYNLYSYSFQDYGQDKFNENLLHNIIESHKGETNISHPCYLNGYKEDYVYKGISYTINGENDINKCQETIEKFMFINEEKEKSMNDTYQPEIPKDTMFYGISGLYWIAYFFDLTDEKFHAPNEFISITEQYCNKNWEDAKREYKGKVTEDRLKNYCISGFYVYDFLVKGFKLDENKKLIMFPDKINNVEVSWTLGAMSYEIGLQPLKDAKYYIDY